MAYDYKSPWKVHWMKALYRGDCLEIEHLLNKDEGLVNIYSRPTECCNYASDFAARFDGWKGCSALHIAVKRGWPFLVQKIVNLFREVPEISSDSPGADVLPEHNLTTAMLEELLLAFDSNYHLDALALAVVNGNTTIVRILAKASTKCPNNPYHVTFPFTDQNGDCPPDGMQGEDSVDRNATGFDCDEETGERRRDMEAKENTLWSITEEAFQILGDSTLDDEMRKYQVNPAYNFLPMKLFFPHYWIVDKSSYFDRPNNQKGFLTRMHPRRSKSAIAGYIDKVVQILKERPDGSALMNFLFSLKDGRGKTLAHVLTSVYSHDRDWTCIHSWGEETRSKFVSVLDGAGRTVAHEFVDGIIGRPTVPDMSYNCLQVIDIRELTKVSRRLDEGLFEYIDLDTLFTRNGYADHNYDFHSNFDGNYLCEPGYEPGLECGASKNVLHESTPFHYAALHNCSTFFIDLIRNCRIPLEWNATCRMRLKQIEKRRLGVAFQTDLDEFAQVNIFQVAALSGSYSVFKFLLEIDEVYDGLKRRNAAVPKQESYNRNGPFSALYIASSAGDSAMIQALLTSQKFDPLMTTAYTEDTALHFAADADYSGPLLLPTLLDLVNVSHRPRMAMPHTFRFLDKTREEFIHAEDSKRKGCISLLLQAGIDIWQANANFKIADPGENASPNFRLWWYEKLLKETQELRAGYNTAANAISVTGALVATASFVGPLQPPLGYANSTDSPDSVLETVHAEITSVRVFMVCDTLALYFALVAILLSLMPLLPRPQESMLQDLSRARRVVTASIGFLILSVVLFLVGFAAASIAVIPNEDGSYSGGLTLSSVVIGGAFSLYLFCLFLLRLRQLVFHNRSHLGHKKSWIRRIF
ncbi:hypothetical protein R1sor_004204 [Riccia sorocarpa]|uniref:PGG domain-containing protein n=1 Tax=Riccia sorocarpa TaxID=122646 RepID=A0ABD3H6M7_9MARC